MKLDGGSGEVLWMKLIGGAAGLDDRGWSIIVGPDDHPVVTGITGNADGSADFRTIKLHSTDGSVIWSRSDPGANYNVDERGGWLAVCDNGDVVMANKTWSPETSYDVVLYRYAGGDGATVWAVQHGSADGSSDDPNGMVRDAAGDLLVAGVHGGDFLVFKIDQDTGDLLWSAAYDGPASAYDAANCVLEGPGGTVIAAGFSTGDGTSWDATTVGFSPVDGTPVWSERFDAGDHQADEASVLAASPLGDLYVVGYGYRLATDSDLLSLRYLFDTAQGVEEIPPARPLLTVHPNPLPLQGSLTIEARGIGAARAGIYDAAGRRVRSLSGRISDPGRLIWDGRDESGILAGPGVYIVRVEGGGRWASCKVVRIR